MFGTFLWATFWSAATALATTAGVVALVYAGKQIRLQALLEAQKIWTADGFTDTRRRIFERLDDLNSPWEQEDEPLGYLACRKLDDFAYVARFIGRRRTFKVWGNPLAKAWLILKPLVEKERDEYRFEDKWDGFRKLGEKALKKALKKNSRLQELVDAQEAGTSSPSAPPANGGGAGSGDDEKIAHSST